MTPDTRLSSTVITTAPTSPIEPSPLSAATERDAPPHARVAEVVGVTGIAPQAPIHHRARVRRVGLEAGELRVADDLEEQAHGPHGDADAGEHPEVRVVGHLPELDGQRDDPHEDALEPEDGEEAHPPEARAVARSELLVAEVLPGPRLRHAR